jgi:energy-coupling factor transport system ATP-binding protein
MIDIDNLSFRYKSSDRLNLSNINLHISKGECVLILGRSGCGKTTVLRLLNGLIPHYFEGEIEGSVKVSCEGIEDMPLYKISEKVGTVYQNPRSQFFNIDTDGEIAFGIENIAYSKEELKYRMNKTVKETGIENLLGRSLFELSGGEKQKIAFASIYAMTPDIYLLDEPSSNLDSTQTENLRQHIVDLKNQHKTIVITEHRIYYLKDVVDRVVYMDNGKIQKEFDSKEFFSIDDKSRISMGLRAVQLQQIQFKQRQNQSKDRILDMKNISSGYKKQAIVKDVSFSANSGEVIGIIGHNGAGKSTLAESICGLNKLLSGEISYNLEKVSEKQRIKLGYMVFQDVDYQLFADSVKNECHYGIANVDEKDVSQILETLNLLDFKEKHPATLSGGQKQRLAVAVSMVCNKDILIFDEPTSGLDFESMKKVTILLDTLSKAGKIIFVVTHDYELICESCDRVISLNKGSLMFDLYLNDKTAKQISRQFMFEESERCE